MTPQNREQNLTVVVGPSGVGKGTVVRELMRRYPQVTLSVSNTTRAPRPGEVDGIHYHFVSESEFTDAIAAGEFLEWAVVHGKHRYGTLRAEVERAIEAGRMPLLEIDLDGARQVRATWPQARFVFIAPPSWEELQARLRGRGTETDAEVQRRLETAQAEMAAIGEFENVIVNREVGQAVDELASLMELT